MFGLTGISSGPINSREDASAHGDSERGGLLGKRLRAGSEANDGVAVGCGAWSRTGEEGRDAAAAAWRLASISRRWSRELKAVLRALHDVLVSSKSKPPRVHSMPCLSHVSIPFVCKVRSFNPLGS